MVICLTNPTESHTRWKLRVVWSFFINYVFLHRFFWETSLGKKLKLHGPFLWIGFICLKATEPLRGDSLLFTTKFPGIPVTHFMDLGRMKGWVDPVVLISLPMDWKSSAVASLGHCFINAIVLGCGWVQKGRQFDVLREKKYESPLKVVAKCFAGIHRFLKSYQFDYRRQ